MNMRLYASEVLEKVGPPLLLHGTLVDVTTVVS